MHWLEIDHLLSSVFKHGANRVRIDDLERPDSMDWMRHASFLFQGFNGKGRLASVQQVPVCWQFFLMSFSPCFHESPLPLWKTTSDQIHWIDRKHSGFILEICMEVRRVVRLAGF